MDLISKIIYGHDNNNLVYKYRNGIKQIHKDLIRYVIDTPVAQVIDDLNIFTTCINNKIILGLIFDKNDNPYDYKDIFEELLNELLNNEKSRSFDDEIEIENLLISVFIDIRRFGDEFEKYPELDLHYHESFTKVFLFGIDYVGKSSLVRRLKTGEYSDNYFTPTKRFDIEYFQNSQKGVLAIWDMPGQSIFRKKWLVGLQDSNIIIYMIDIANQIRFEESKREFWKIINRFELVGIPILILSNKIDLLDHSNKGNSEQLKRLRNEIMSFFEFDKIRNRDWKFLFTSVKTNFNIKSVIELIYDMIQVRENPL